jgi:hypothetical protein
MRGVLGRRVQFVREPRHAQLPARYTALAATPSALPIHATSRVRCSLPNNTPGCRGSNFLFERFESPVIGVVRQGLSV